MKKTPTLSSLSGLSLLETLFVTVILAAVLIAFTRVHVSMRKEAAAEAIDVNLQIAANRILQSVMGDLKSSGYDTDGGLAFPYFFEDGKVDPGYDVHEHDAPHAPEDHGVADPVSRGIVFVLPADDDDDGIPDLTTDGEASWNSDAFSYVLVPDRDGSNRLERRTNGTDARVIARNVETLYFDDPAGTGFTIPLDAVRLQATLARTGADGLTYRHSLEAVVKLRNGGLSR